MHKSSSLSNPVDLSWRWHFGQFGRRVDFPVVKHAIGFIEADEAKLKRTCCWFACALHVEKTPTHYATAWTRSFERWEENAKPARAGDETGIIGICWKIRPRATVLRAAGCDSGLASSRRMVNDDRDNTTIILSARDIGDAAWKSKIAHR